MNIDLNVTFKADSETVGMLKYMNEKLDRILGAMQDADQIATDLKKINEELSSIVNPVVPYPL